ncbi:MAG: discoidin domain-containing protein [Verrucomicrobia bacterium]|nr:discoidin domain-containing protein [Verrucomicrobiota bacterium]
MNHCPFRLRFPAIRRTHLLLFVALLCAWVPSCLAQESVYKFKTFPEDYKPNFENYATIEAWVGGVPVYALGASAYIYGVSPDFLPGAAMQEGNKRPPRKIQPKKSWEISANPFGAQMGEPAVRTMWNDSQPMLPIHLIDGDPDTVWCSYGGPVPDARPEWVRIDLPVETEVGAVALVCAQSVGMTEEWLAGKFGAHPEGDNFYKWAGKALPNELTVQVSRDAWHWETVYENRNFSGNEQGPSVIEFEPTPNNANKNRIKRDKTGATIIEFKPRRAKQILVTGKNFKRRVHKFVGWAFSIGELEVLAPSGENLALVSRGAGVSVSSVSYLFNDNRLAHDALYGPVQYDLGLKWVRVGADTGLFCWQAVERKKGVLQVDPAADNVITELTRNGVGVIMNLDVKANWIYKGKKEDWKKARVHDINNIYLEHPGWSWETPELLEGYLRYVDYMARHFKGRVAYYEIGNEWAGPRGVYDRAVRRIKAIDPGAKIMVGVGRMNQFKPMLEKWIAEVPKEDLALLMPDAVGSHPTSRVDAGLTFDDLHKFYWEENRQAMKDCRALGFKGVFAATEVYSWSSYPPGPREIDVHRPNAAIYHGESELVRAKYLSQNFTGHAGLGMMAFQCNVYWISAQVGQSLFRGPVPSSTIHPIQPDAGYYTLRTLCTVMDGWRPAEFEARFDGADKLQVFTFQRGRGERMIAVWRPGATGDASPAIRTALRLPGLRAHRAFGIDAINGTEQELDFKRMASDTSIEGLLLRDYATMIRIEE